MTRRVIDCNVAVVANGRNTNASLECRIAAIEALSTFLRVGSIIVDIAGEMLDEYRTYCDPKGQPGVGDRFFREVLMNYAGKVERIDLEKAPNGSFVDFPDDPELANFDLSDRKFAAAARKTSVPVMNATDSDWLDHQVALTRNGINLEFVCGTNRKTWITKSASNPKAVQKRVAPSLAQTDSDSTPGPYGCVHDQDVLSGSDTLSRLND